MHEKILIVDDEKDIGLLIQGLLEDEGYTPSIATSSDQARTLIAQENPDLVIQDIWLQGSTEDGVDILKSVKKERPDIPFIMISGHGTIETAVSTIKLGAYDFIEKPFKSDRLLLMVHRALENAELRKQNTQLKQRTTERKSNLSSQIPETIRTLLDKVSGTNSRVLITGEAGTGKNISAQYLHEKSERADQPFMVLNCKSQNPEKLEVELFGSINGYNGEPGRAGLLELVDGGTLLLDEVMDIPMEIQGKILILLQDATYHKLGANHAEATDIRVIATTSTNVEEKLSTGLFREDLYYRLNVVPVEIPPLRKRRQDIPELIKNYTKQKFSGDALDKLKSYHWPGNIKQLHNVLEWVSIMNHDKSANIKTEDLPPELSGNSVITSNEQEGADLLMERIMQKGLREARESFERYYLLAQVNKFDGNISKTAEFIGMERSALHRKLKSLDVFANDKQSDAKQNVA